MKKIVYAAEYLNSLGFNTTIRCRGHVFNMWLPVKTLVVYDELIYQVEDANEVNTIGEGVQVNGLFVETGSEVGKIYITTAGRKPADIIQTILHEEAHAAYTFNHDVSYISKKEEEAIADAVAIALMRSNRFKDEDVISADRVVHMVCCDLFSDEAEGFATRVVFEMLTDNLPMDDLDVIMGYDVVEDFFQGGRKQIRKAIATMLPCNLLDTRILCGYWGENLDELKRLSADAISESVLLKTFHEGVDGVLTEMFNERLEAEAKEDLETV